MKILALIPARMGSSRFPGKPMAKILGKPMIGHVYERVSQSSILSLTAVATCDTEIAEYIRSIGGKAVMTGSHHERASDRCAEALEILEKEKGIRFDIVVMVQGDEPMTHPEMLRESVEPLLENNDISVVNLISKIESVEEFEDRNCIKVVCDLNNNAIYFSREPIPTRSKVDQVPMFKQVCIIPFRRDFLIEYTKLEPTPLEIIESVDMMRILEHGLKVKMAPTKYKTSAVDTPEDLKRVEKLMEALV
ncbi:3-deoxy-D-manno-octulosonate cytidylyltransferase [Leptospira inadai serovar Lyme str. 10]|uniref:3-deoxy-manno-octulosonate cytidylyltransferase n=2 Tax=Leptospira inadai serovar Lyme TaxID=293084 RepID=V6HUT7_9LEPT|nr:3-deoxy-manno-octulosonate cytidylyltransferase [Leptospira inadai]EQA36554.1 3-deoxy-D-manno-octulosonate cytidylyltransferase [Leptospira inadai serovar Lyme str. 10]PNV75841.1 3-deoxy-manno-octulosonate cytidylyltransferase [Leptospira inadai serovar Lyme]